MSININHTETDRLNSNYEILDNLRTAILILDYDLNYIFTNTADIDLLGSTTILKKITEIKWK